MHWIVIDVYHRNTNKAVYCFYAGFLLFYPLLGQNGYKCCLNTPNPSSNFIISQMHWIMTRFDHRNASKATY